MNPINTRILPFSLLAACSLAFSGCESTRQLYFVRYPLPQATQTTNTPSPIDMVAVSVSDYREDRSINYLLEEEPAKFIGRSLEAELLATGAFSRNEPGTDRKLLRLEVDWWETSWATPDSQGVARTEFGVTLATGLLGALAYGSTGTPAVVRVRLGLRLIDTSNGNILLTDQVETLHVEQITKLSLGSLETRCRVLANGIKKSLTEVAAKSAKAVRSNQ